MQGITIANNNSVVPGTRSKTWTVINPCLRDTPSSDAGPSATSTSEQGLSTGLQINSRESHTYTTPPVGAIAGGVVGGVFALVSIATILFLCSRNKRRQAVVADITGDTSARTDINGKNIEQRRPLHRSQASMDSIEKGAAASVAAPIAVLHHNQAQRVALTAPSAPQAPWYSVSARPPSFTTANQRSTPPNQAKHMSERKAVRQQEQKAPGPHAAESSASPAASVMSSPPPSPFLCRENPLMQHQAFTKAALAAKAQQQHAQRPS